MLSVFSFELLWAHNLPSRKGIKRSGKWDRFNSCRVPIALLSLQDLAPEKAPRKGPLYDFAWCSLQFVVFPDYSVCLVIAWQASYELIEEYATNKIRYTVQTMPTIVDRQTLCRRQRHKRKDTWARRYSLPISTSFPSISTPIWNKVLFSVNKWGIFI